MQLEQYPQPSKPWHRKWCGSKHAQSSQTVPPTYGTSKPPPCTAGASTQAYDQTNATGVPYDHFIVPGLIMMALLMNSLMAASSGIYFPRFIGTMSDLLTSPLSYLEIVMGFALSAAARALAIGITIFIISWIITGISVSHVIFTLILGLLS